MSARLLPQVRSILARNLNLSSSSASLFLGARLLAASPPTKKANRSNGSPLPCLFASLLPGFLASLPLSFFASLPLSFVPSSLLSLRASVPPWQISVPRLAIARYCAAFPSRSSTTSEIKCPRTTASVLPSGDHEK